MDLGGRTKRQTKAPSKTFSKSKHVTIPYEDFNVGEWYAITINPCDKYQHWEAGNRVGRLLTEIKSDIIFFNIMQYELWMEISSKGRLHFHGYVKAEKENEKNFFFISGLPRLLRKCTVVLKELDENEMEWNRYCRKQWQFHLYILQMHYTEMPLRINSIVVETPSEAVSSDSVCDSEGAL